MRIPDAIDAGRVPLHQIFGIRNAVLTRSKGRNRAPSRPVKLRQTAGLGRRARREPGSRHDPEAPARAGNGHAFIGCAADHRSLFHGPDLAARDPAASGLRRALVPRPGSIDPARGQQGVAGRDVCRLSAGAARPEHDRRDHQNQSGHHVSLVGGPRRLWSTLRRPSTQGHARRLPIAQLHKCNDARFVGGRRLIARLRMDADQRLILAFAFRAA